MPAQRNQRQRQGINPLQELWRSRSTPMSHEPSTSHVRFNLLKQNAAGTSTARVDYPYARPPPLQLHNVNGIRMLGKGVYGQVLLCRVMPPRSRLLDRQGYLFAMKVMKKFLIRPEQTADAEAKNAERECLADLPWSPFVASLISPFSDPQNLYLALELVPCGSLRQLIQAYAPFSPSVAAFYLSNIVCGLEALEQLGIVHCDLKPDNILIGVDGYPNLADFGQSKYVSEERGWFANGTPSYMAPELLRPQSCFGHQIDWWASGCILFEMITKRIAFRGKTDIAVNQKTVAGEYKWPLRARPGRRLRDIVDNLLTVNVDERLGTEGAAEVMSHPWLAQIHWQKMKNRVYTAPYDPPSPNILDDWQGEGFLSSDDLPDILNPDLPASIQSHQ